MKDLEKVVSGIVLDEHLKISLRELCGMCGITPDLIIDMINEGIIERPFDEKKRNWYFRGYEVHRIQIVLRLQRDLRINLPGAALALELLEQLEKLQRRVNT